MSKNFHTLSTSQFKFLFAKYFSLGNKLDNKKFVNTFLNVEKWLHDTPPIPGEINKKIVNECYRNNS